MNDLLRHEASIGSLAGTSAGTSALTVGGQQMGKLEQHSSSSEDEGRRERAGWKETEGKYSESSEEYEDQFTMKVCVCVCACVCVRVCVCAHAYTQCMCTCLCLCVCMCGYVHA